ncbi:MAG: hypothetical protein ABEJ25_06620 [Candidatus Bipolaricaulia bacterium]
MVETNPKLDLAPENQEFVIIAGGKIGPLKELVKNALKEGLDNDIRLFYGANSSRGLNGYEELKDISEISDKFNMVTALNSPSPDWEGEVGLITDVVRDQLDPDEVGKCFVYGNRTMVEETMRTLANLGIPESKIEQETFGRIY